WSSDSSSHHLEEICLFCSSLAVVSVVTLGDWSPTVVESVLRSTGLM
ncbi:hypothetical protein A2U01_0108703, partial [Trifolium medium]|nr:hypothetical protein [Trifolium medium]